MFVQLPINLNHFFLIVNKQGNENDLFSKLAKKYNAPNPIVEVSKGSVVSASPSPFPLTPTNVAPSHSVTSPFGQPSASSPSTSGFGGNKSAFGQSTQASTGFGISASSSTFTPFGQTSMPSTPFGNTLRSTPSTPFGQPQGQTNASNTSAQFASKSPFGGEARFGGKTTREILVSFYEQHNPAQLAKVDQVLQKYAGQEEQLLMNLAKKYKLDPATFGLTGAPAAPLASTFGAPVASFGQTSGFGASSTGFGGMKTQSSNAFGQSFGSNPSSGFGSFANTPQTGGFGSLSSNPSTSGFGNTSFSAPGGTPFGAPRR